jgi:selenide,water dikinase
LSHVVRQLAERFPAADYPHVLVGLGAPDDAAVFRLDESRALIATTDFFSPVVDDPYTYGYIAATNAMSDVYAMGGEVLFALNIAGFGDAVDAETIAEILAGGADAVRAVGAAITGGHTLTAPEPFYGLSVTGLIHPDRVMTKGGAQPGDLLYLTKALGTGIITTAGKNTGAGEGDAARAERRAAGRPDLAADDYDAAVSSMKRANRAAAQAAQVAHVLGATDITGYGLLGHTSEMAAASFAAHGAAFRLEAAAVPLLPGIEGYVAARYLTSASRRNPLYYTGVRFADDVPAWLRTVMWEAETSGGLLLAVPAAHESLFRDACAAREQPAWRIGEVIDAGAAGAGIEVV